jgi:hypothetical protein
MVASLADGRMVAEQETHDGEVAVQRSQDERCVFLSILRVDRRSCVD